MFFRERIIFFIGTRTYNDNRTILGNGIDVDTERTTFESCDSMSSALPRKSKMTAFFTVQMLIG